MLRNPSRLVRRGESAKSTPSVMSATAKRTRHRGQRTTVTNRTPLYRRPLSLVLIGLLCLVLLWVGVRAYSARTAYQDASAQINALQAAYASEDLTEMTVSDVAQIERRLDDLHVQLRRLEHAVSLPVGVKSVVTHSPWLGPRYEAAQDMLETGLLLSDAGASGARIGRETLAAFDQSGISADDASSSPTWLDVIGGHEADIQHIVNQIERARSIRSGINTELLPDRAQSQLDTLDSALDRFKIETLVESNLAPLQAGLGANGTARYLLLFHNPAELRPSGGFPGTIALITIEHGQLRSYEISDVRDLTYDYIDQRESKRPQPWPIQHYFPQDGFLLHDATWFADFPRSGQEVMSMYAETDWPAIDGIIAVEPAAIRNILGVTGPLTVDVDGEPRNITSANFYDEIERQRRLRRAGVDVETTHKEVVALVGEAILGRLKSADQQELVQVVEALTGSADRRDIQFYAANPKVQAALDQRQWTGRLIPDPDLPTLAITFANVAINKASMAMQPRMLLTLSGVEQGRREATLKLDMQHTGSNEGDPLYEGFQRWWIEVTLPAGSSLITSGAGVVKNPESPNGGSYLIELFPGQMGHLELTFSMPESDSILIRRQPGLTPMELSVVDAQCNQAANATLNADVTFELDQICH